jgi:hypothetical protein
MTLPTLFNRRPRALALAAALAACAVPAAASLITLQTRHATDAMPALGSAAADGQYYRDTLAGLSASAPGAGYCDASLGSLSGISNQAQCGGSASDIGFAYLIRFGLAPGQAGDVSLQLAPDFGRGGALFLDGALLAVKTDDLWWGGDFGAVGEIFSLAHLALDAGNHQLALYGLEGCCDGPQAARFRLGQGDWSTFATGDALQLRSAVPEPTSPVLVASALGAALWMSRRRRALPAA